MAMGLAALPPHKQTALLNALELPHGPAPFEPPPFGETAGPSGHHGRDSKRRGSGAANPSMRTKSGWRKYGKKQVKAKSGGGPPLDRAYFRCSHPGCPAKKMEEIPLL